MGRARVGAARGGPVSDGPVSDGPVSDGPVLDEAAFRDQVALTMHELNNVLSVIQLTADLLDREAVPAGQASQTIRDQVQEAVKIVERLRRHARAAVDAPEDPPSARRLPAAP